jgi:hypothetical protein
MSAESQTFFQWFKWEIFGDAAFEDVQGLWEPLWSLRGSLKRPGMSEEDRQEFAERALRELARDGLIYFFRVPLNMNPNDTADDDSLRLTADECDATLNDNWWRGTNTLPDRHPNVWWWVTEKGLERARNPSSEMQSDWFRSD